MRFCFSPMSSLRLYNSNPPSSKYSCSFQSPSRFLAEVPEERFEDREYPARWKTLYCVDAMLEHAVMHPIRHTFQLERLLARA